MNMGAYGGLTQYRETSMTTMTQGELLILVYDEAVKRISRAEISLKNDKYSDFIQSMNKIEEIIKHLRSTLDTSVQIGADLEQLYKIMQNHIVRIRIDKDLELIAQVKTFFTEMREAFQVASENTLNERPRMSAIRQ